MKGILIYQPTSKSAPLADFIDGLDPRLREKILLRLYFLTQLEKPEMKEPHFKRFSIERYDRPISQRHLRSSLKGGRSMLLSNQQKYILEILKEFKYLRVRQLHALVQAHYRTQGIKIDERRMEIMLRQMRTGTNYVWLRGDVVSYGDRRIDPRLLEALDVMLELTRVQPGFYSKDGLHEPFLLRFTGNGKGAGYLFSVAWLDAATHIATVPRMKGERIIWISEIGSFGEIDLPRHHFFAARQENGTHRFFGSNEPEKI